MRQLEVTLAVEAQPVHGEGPWWDVESQTLWWVDILGKRIHLWESVSGLERSFEVPETVGAVVGRSSGGVVALQENGVVSVGGDGTVTWLVQVESDDPTTRFNDGKCDPSGRLLGGTMSYDSVQGAGSLYSIDSNHVATVLLSGLTISNGLAWTPDGSTLYLVDSGPSMVRAFDYSTDTGEIVGSERSRFEVASGVPDGMTIDVDGCLWIAQHGVGVVGRYTPEGLCDTQIVLPVPGVTSCAFGGSDLGELFITTSGYGYPEGEVALAGSIFACSPGTSGFPEPKFLG